jgi:hypothetical protein
MASVTTIMKLNDEYEDFEVKLDRVHPSYNETLAVLLFDKTVIRPETKEARQLRRLYSGSSKLRSRFSRSAI